MKSTIILLAAIIKFTHCTELDFVSLLSEIADLELSEDGKLNFTQLVTKYGHTAEQYEVTTEDGYVVKVFHIPGKRSSVLLTHGLGTDADPYVIRGHDSLGIALADKGYDVWLLNNRGTKFSRRHIELDPDKDKKTFWNFSFHEMGYYDLAATIDFVLYQTGEEKILAIGHSQGASQFFALTSTRPEYNEKIKLFLALAPGAFFFNMPLLFQIGASAGPILLEIGKTLGIEELCRDRGALVTMIKTICTKGVISYEVCVRAAMFPFVGYNPTGLELSFLSTLFGHAPSGFARKNLEHYDQLYLRKKFAMFDYGVKGNLDKYGRRNPPDYPLSKVTTNVAIMSGKLDTLSLVHNGKVLKKRLPNVVHFEEIEATTHIDFIFSADAPKYLFPSIFRLLQKYD
ncbi:lysosomal acid lipase/cholesteryl ester hydrolase-like [Leguminivora glycinivorella]|uniref:lysosomal acid lipase/cholesteryl ester hydrolase-like n=1 Tax=Leguminivora glycinivorella TaxID=1035111 RepID=UPI00200E0CF8|nr:lysosomal acid lipase/cholesteryl ester hydrolase-like [Leguminivora glycinivorella]